MTKSRSEATGHPRTRLHALPQRALPSWRSRMLQGRFQFWQMARSGPCRPPRWRAFPIPPGPAMGSTPDIFLPACLGKRHKWPSLRGKGFLPKGSGTLAHVCQRHASRPWHNPVQPRALRTKSATSDTMLRDLPDGVDRGGCPKGHFDHAKPILRQHIGQRQRVANIIKRDHWNHTNGRDALANTYLELQSFFPLDWRIDKLTAVRVSGGGALWFSSQSTTVCAACTPIPAMSQRTDDSDG